MVGFVVTDYTAYPEGGRGLNCGGRGDMHVEGFPGVKVDSE